MKKLIALLALFPLGAFAQGNPNFWELDGGWDNTPRLVGPAVSSWGLIISQPLDTDWNITQFKVVFCRLGGRCFQRFLEISDAYSVRVNPDGSMAYSFLIERQGQLGIYNLRISSCQDYFQCSVEVETRNTPVVINGITYPGWSVERRNIQ